MNKNDTKDGLIRIISIFSVSVLLLGLLLTGMRLYWYSHAYTGFFARVIDAVSIAGQTHFIHYRLGLALVSVLGFVFVFYFLSGWAGLVGIQNRSTKTLAWIETFLLLLTIASGLSLYQGWQITRAFHTQLGLIHLYSTSLLLLVTVILIVVIVRRRRLTNEVNRNIRSSNKTGIVLVIALAASLIYGWAATLGDKPSILVSRFTGRAIQVDGRVSSNEWSGSEAVKIDVTGSSGQDGGNVRELSVRSVRSKRRIYFLIRWRDRTRSHNRQLVKTDSGWRERVSEPVDLFGERKYFEDMLALSFGEDSRGCVSSCHLTGTARSYQSAGTHYTDGETIDLWKWQSVSSDPSSQAEDAFWTEYTTDKDGGRRADNDTKNGSYKNLNTEWQQPYFFPLNPFNKSFIWVGTGIADPYLLEADTFSVGSMIPSVLVDRMIGDRGDVRARGRWHGGRWTVELSRTLRTRSPHDVEFHDTLYMGVAVFDNAEKKHAYNLKPIRLVINQ